MVTDLPDYEKKIIIVTPPGEYPAIVQVDLRKILGVDLISPTIAGCVPTSIENEAIAYDLANDWFKTYIENDAIAYDDVNDRFKVDIEAMTLEALTVIQPDAALLKATVSATDLDIRALLSTDVVTVKSITDALPTGANAIGKLAANSGVDIGDVDVKTMPDVTQATAANLKATVTQAEKDRTISDITKTTTIVSIQATAANNTIIQTPAAGKKIRVKLIDVWNNGTAAITVYLRFAAAGTARFKKTLAANAGFIINLIGTNWEGAADEVLYINLSAIGTVDVTVMKDEV
jgi:hypothetical protein